jgi:hypothetical protein
MGKSITYIYNETLMEDIECLFLGILILIYNVFEKINMKLRVFNQVLS